MNEFQIILGEIKSLSRSTVELIYDYAILNDRCHCLSWFIETTDYKILQIISDYARLNLCCMSYCINSLPSINQSRKQARRLYRWESQDVYASELTYCLECESKLFKKECQFCHCIIYKRESKVAYFALIDTVFSNYAGNTCPECSYELLQIDDGPFRYCNNHKCKIPNIPTFLQFHRNQCNKHFLDYTDKWDE